VTAESVLDEGTVVTVRLPGLAPATTTELPTEIRELALEP
jgi:hypothetical protein